MLKSDQIKKSPNFPPHSFAPHSFLLLCAACTDGVTNRQTLGYVHIRRRAAGGVIHKRTPENPEHNSEKGTSQTITVPPGTALSDLKKLQTVNYSFVLGKGPEAFLSFR